MDHSLAKLDLNLLRVLHMLLEERSVTRSGHRLFLSQPAMSKSLKRLRLLLDDELFFRSPHGLQPTFKAQQLQAPLNLLFSELHQHLLPSKFNAATARGTICISAPEQFALALIPPLLKSVSEKAPSLSIKVSHLNGDHLELLAAGTLDFVLNLHQPLPTHFFTHSLFNAEPRVWLRRGHPLTESKKLTMAQIFSFPLIGFQHQNMTARISEELEECLLRAGVRSHLLLDTSLLMIAVNALIETDAVMISPDYLFGAPLLNVSVVKRSIKHIAAFKNLGYRLSLVQHARTKGSAMHDWLLDEIRAVIATRRLGEDTRVKKLS